LPCSVATNRSEAFDAMRPGVAFYAGFFPRYNRLIAESGFPEAAHAIRTAWEQGDQEGARRAVPDALIAATGIVGAPTECRERLEAYRHAGIALPIISPFSRGPNGKQRALEAIRACAP
jgi:alkanesulfonate monooxygenase SsuD/methylene tetrahydromethanopterin reductase-like flavin-dependent oxidoreductase (luciferase family)